MANAADHLTILIGDRVFWWDDNNNPAGEHGRVFQIIDRDEFWEVQLDPTDRRTARAYVTMRIEKRN